MSTVTSVRVVQTVRAGENERDYLVRLGLAQPTRGRLSAKAHAALDSARAAGFTFAVKAVKAPATPKATVAGGSETPAPRPTVVRVPPQPAPDKSETKIIRAWAKQQDGLSVGDRGRLGPDVIAAYRAAFGDAPARTVTVRRPTPLDMPRRTNIIGLATKDGITHVQDRCGKCRRSVQNCHTDTCPQGPMAYGGVTGPLTLV